MKRKRSQASARAARKPKKTGVRGKPFTQGFDARRNLKGPSPEVWELKKAIAQDAPAAIEQLRKRVAEGSDSAIKYTLDQAIGKPKESLEVSGPGGKPIEVTDSRTRLAERLAALAAARRAQGGGPKPQ